MTVKDIRRRVLPDLDDEFAKDVGEFESLEALRDRVRADLKDEAAENAERQVRSDLLTQLSDACHLRAPDLARGARDGSARSRNWPGS